MGEDIRIVKLYRQAISENYTGHRLTKDNNVQHLYVTDYFTQLTVEKKEISDSFSEIVSLDGEELESEDAIAAQSYVLYFSAEMMCEYENCKEEEKGGRCNPFESLMEEERPFLSMIQVHITPEILHCMENADMVLEEKNIILKPFLDDLYDVVGKYWREKKDFVFRVYHVLSAGDFAVVIRSRTPRSSFEVSSRLRRRTAGSAGQDNRKLAMYKTYTLLAMEWEIRRELIPEILKKTPDDKMLIRACYSCGYWSELHSTENEKRPFSDNDREYMGLNGRYDFITELTMEEFFILYPLILKCRLGEELNEELMCAIENSGTEKVKKMADLLKHRKLSYLNERYVIAGLNTVYSGMEKEPKLTKKILLRTDWENLEPLEDCAKRRIDDLKSRMDGSKERLKAIPEMHRNGLQYFMLLENLISSCRVINRQSDTRNYAMGLLEQLETVEDSLEEYLAIYGQVEDDDKFEFAEILMNNLRGAVHILDSYSEYIRNNNMQSLQTPNYNIESKMGMEKLLIGYSEYLRQYIQNYRLGFRKANIEQDVGKEFYPVIIPDLNRTDISVEALFPRYAVEIEGTGMDKKQERKTLLVVTCSALKELSDTPVLLSILSHEVAHQFRYEDKEKRNSVILSMLVYDYAEAIARRIVRAVKIEEEARLLTKEDLQNLLQSALAKSIEVWMRSKVKKDEWSEMSLGAVEGKYKELRSKFISAWDYRGELERVIKIFVRNLEREYQCDKAILAENLRKIMNDLERASEQRPEAIDEIKASLKKIVAAYAKPSGQEIENAQETEKSEVAPEYEEIYNAVENIFYEMSAEYELDDWLPEQLDADFFEGVYSCAVDLWEKQKKDYLEKKNFAMLRAWNLVGRHFGLEMKGEMFRKKGETRLKKELMSVWLNGMEIGSPEDLVSSYREITSDLSMCCMLDLSLFAYVNLCALMMWKEMLVCEFNLSRMVIVIHVMWSTEEKTYNDLCSEMFDNLIVYAGENWRGTEAGKKDFLQCMKTKKPKKSKATGEREWDYLTYDEAKRILEREKGTAREEEVCNFVKHLEWLLLLCEKLAIKGKDAMKKLESQTQLLKDYKAGVEALQKVREELDPKRNKVNSIQKFEELRRLIKEFLKKEHYHVGNVRSEKINKASMDYLLWLYYCRKFHNARSGDEEVVANEE